MFIHILIVRIELATILGLRIFCNCFIFSVVVVLLVLHSEFFPVLRFLYRSTEETRGGRRCFGAKCMLCFYFSYLFGFICGVLPLW